MIYIVMGDFFLLAVEKISLFVFVFGKRSTDYTAF